MIDTGRNGDDLAEEVYPHLDEWLERNKDRDRWFLHTNFWDPHTLYDVPEAYGHPFKDSPPPAWITQDVIAAHRQSYGPHDAFIPVPGLFGKPRELFKRAPQTIANVEDWKQWIDGYDTAIHYVDFYVGKLIDKLKRLGIYEDTAIIVSADHGENQGELNIYGDHQTADQICHRLPLIVRWPGVTDAQAGTVQHGLHYNIDLARTLVELAGGTIPESWDGIDFSQTLKDGTFCGRSHLILSHGAWSCQRSVRWDDYILIRTYHAGNKNFPELMLFDLANDPHEQHNLAEKRNDLVGYGLRLMDRWVAEQLERSGQPDPLHAVIAEGGPLHASRKFTEELCAHLRETGRVEHARWLETHGGGKTH